MCETVCVCVCVWVCMRTSVCAHEFMCVCVTLSLTTTEVRLVFIRAASVRIRRLSRNRLSILWEVASTIGIVEALLCDRKP